jgi:isoquinoline 1-oxidoreductase beta subunit
MKTAITRRDFIKTSGLSGAALLLGLRTGTAQEPTILSAAQAEAIGIELNNWIAIDTNGLVTLINHRSEMGQGSFQSVPQILAEELEVDINQVKVVFAQGSQTKYGSQVTGGSSTIRGSYKQLLRLSATAREMLIQAAANQWSVAKETCFAENGMVIHRPTEKKLNYGALVSDAARLTPPASVRLKDPAHYKVLRQPLPRIDTPLKTNGKAIFGLDKKLPGMLYAMVERSPRFSGKVKSFNEAEVKALPGVKHVLKVDMAVFASMRQGVGVVADSLWAAMQARKVLKVEWDDSGFPHHSTEQLYTKMREDLKSKPLWFKAKGEVDLAWNKSAKNLEAVYETPYEAHACMEPLNCIADFKNGKLEIWGPIQGPDWVQKDVAELMGLKPEDVTVNMTFLGGGFGRKAFLDYPHEAAVLSKTVGAPVQVVWSREDDMTQGPFRPGMVYQCKGGVTAQGSIAGFETIMTGQNMGHQNPGADKISYNDSVTEGFPETYFNSIPHYRFGDVPLDSPVPVMWWRSVYSSTNAFAFESFMDELALAAGKDPLEFRKQHFWDGRYHALAERLATVSGWNSRKPNEGFGVAITECFSSIVGEVVKVSRKPTGGIKIDKVWAVMDCGWYVNPDIIRAQVEGSIIMALGAATKHATLFADGKAVQKNFDTYKMTRISEVPEMEVHIMENEEKAGGVGEPGLPPFTPALTNAIFDLTGKRIRVLPFMMNEIG